MGVRRYNTQPQGRRAPGAQAKDGASGGRLLTLRTELKAQVPLLPVPYQAQGSWSLSPVPNSTHLPSMDPINLQVRHILEKAARNANATASLTELTAHLQAWCRANSLIHNIPFHPSPGHSGIILGGGLIVIFPEHRHCGCLAHRCVLASSPMPVPTQCSNKHACSTCEPGMRVQEPGSGPVHLSPKSTPWSCQAFLPSCLLTTDPSLSPLCTPPGHPALQHSGRSEARHQALEGR